MKLLLSPIAILKKTQSSAISTKKGYISDNVLEGIEEVSQNDNSSSESSPISYLNSCDGPTIDASFSPENNSFSPSMSPITDT